MKKDTRVTIQCPSFRRGKKFEGIITGEKPLAALHIAKHGRTYFVKLDGNNKSTQFHESWLAKLPAPSTPVKDAGQSDKQENRKTTYPEYVLPKDCDYPLIKQEQTETGGTRFFTQDLDEETNIPDLKGWVEKRVLDGLGDETKAGIIGYIHHEHIQEIATILNNFPAMVEALKDCLKCLTMDSDMEEDFAPEIKKAKTILTRINKD